MSAGIHAAGASEVPLPWRRSVFASADVCELAGLALLPGAARPVFEDDLWDLAGLAQAPRSMPGAEKQWKFHAIDNSSWRVVAKECVLALMVPRHAEVAVLPHAPRRARNPRTCWQVLRAMTTWFNWLTARGIERLGEVTQDECEEFLANSWMSWPGRGEARRLTPGAMVAKVRGIQTLALYGELYSSDRYAEGFMPWEGRTASEVVGKTFEKVNKVGPVPDEVLRPLLAAALYLVDVVGPHATAAIAEANARTKVGDDELKYEAPLLLADAVRARLAEQVRCGRPFPRLEPGQISTRIKLGWDPGDRLLEVSLRELSEPFGYRRLRSELVESLRPDLEEALERVGTEHLWAREAALVPRAGDGQEVPWTEPLGYSQMQSLRAGLDTAAGVILFALTGMRSSEALELVVGSRQEPSQTVGGGRRFRLSGKVIKHRRFGGEDDVWVVLAEVDRAVALVEQISGGQPGEPLFRNVIWAERYRCLREWVNGPAGQRLGLEPVPAGPVNPRMLRRTLALELARRPGGLLAAKVALKHVSVVTTEGYAARPGGSQALFLAEVEEAEREHHIQLTAQMFRDYQKGRIPSGPGARHLIEQFASVDQALAETERSEPTVVDNERRIENMLRKTAGTLHIGTANYCWFRDPSQALCLRMAGTPEAKKPLAGMCDSTRCPQATHHPCHRPVWQDRNDTLVEFLDNPRFPAGEKRRLRPELDRTVKVLTQIDAACGARHADDLEDHT